MMLTQLHSRHCYLEISKRTIGLVSYKEYDEKSIQIWYFLIVVITLNYLLPLSSNPGSLSFTCVVV